MSFVLFRDLEERYCNKKKIFYPAVPVSVTGTEIDISYIQDLFVANYPNVQALKERVPNLGWDRCRKLLRAMHYHSPISITTYAYVAYKLFPDLFDVIDEDAKNIIRRKT